MGICGVAIMKCQFDNAASSGFCNEMEKYNKFNVVKMCLTQ